MISFDLDLKNATDEDARLITEAVLSDGVVVIRNQVLTPDEEVNFCERIGNCQEYTDVDRTKHIACHPKILRVTGEKDEHGEEGRQSEGLGQGQEGAVRQPPEAK